MRNFMKKTKIESAELVTEDFIEDFVPKKSPKKKVVIVSALLVLAGLAVCSFKAVNQLNIVSIDDDGGFVLASSPVAATAMRKDVISIPSGVVKANPFMPYRTIGNEIKTEKLVNDVPQIDLIIPPDFPGNNAEAVKIMDTVVSGILFDKFSPSAILNIDGNDYLVKKGDVVHDYKVVNIAQNNVTVQYGKNTYTAGIGELLTEGSVKHNDVSNLDKKFGGEQR